MKCQRIVSVVTMTVGLATAAVAAASEKPLERSEVPNAVLEAVAAKYPGAKLSHFAREIENGKTLYEVVFQVAGTHAEVSVTPEGKIVVEETTITSKELPDAVRKGLASSRYAKARVLRVERVVETAKPDAVTFELMVEQAGSKHELIFEAVGRLAAEERVSHQD